MIKIIHIHHKNRKQIRDVLGVADANRLLQNEPGNYLKYEESLYNTITPGKLQADYKFSRDLNFPGDPWKVYEYKPIEPLNDELDRMNEDSPIQVKRGGLKWGVDKHFLKKSEKSDNSEEITRIDIPKRKTQATLIDSENYDLVSALLPPEFTQQPFETVLGHYVIINDFAVKIDATGRGYAQTYVNWYIHKDLFGSVFEFEYESGDGWVEVVRKIQ